jgi:hypothetical protein
MGTEQGLAGSSAEVVARDNPKPEDLGWRVHFRAQTHLDNFGIDPWAYSGN